MSKKPKIPLNDWAKRRFNPPPCRETQRRWVRACRIYPEPELVGRTYYVDEDAQYVNPDEPRRYGT